MSSLTKLFPEAKARESIMVKIQRRRFLCPMREKQDSESPRGKGLPPNGYLLRMTPEDDGWIWQDFPGIYLLDEMLACSNLTAEIAEEAIFFVRSKDSDGTILTRKTFYRLARAKSILHGYTRQLLPGWWPAEWLIFNPKL